MQTFSDTEWGSVFRKNVIKCKEFFYFKLYIYIVSFVKNMNPSNTDGLQSPLILYIYIYIYIYIYNENCSNLYMQNTTKTSMEIKFVISY